MNYNSEIVNENIKLPCNVGNQISVQNDLCWGVQQTADTADLTSKQNRMNFKLQIGASITTDSQGRTTGAKTNDMTDPSPFIKNTRDNERPPRPAPLDNVPDYQDHRRRPSGVLDRGGTFSPQSVGQRSHGGAFPPSDSRGRHSRPPSSDGGGWKEKYDNRRPSPTHHYPQDDRYRRGPSKEYFP